MSPSLPLGCTRRSDLSTADADCIKSTIQELVQVSQELSTYEHLIGIEKQLNASSDDSTIRGVLRFAVEKSMNLLAAERKRLVQLRHQCSRNSVSFGKAQQAIQFIEATTDILASIQPRI